MAVCIFRVRDVLDSGIRAYHRGQGSLGSHSGSCEEKEKTGKPRRRQDQESVEKTEGAGERQQEERVPWEGGGSSSGERNPAHVLLVWSLSQTGWSRSAGSLHPASRLWFCPTVLISFPHLKSACAQQAASLSLQSTPLSEIFEDLCNRGPEAAFEPT